MRKALPLVLALAGLLFPGETAAQEGCSKPKVYVRVAFVKGVEKQLNWNSPYKTNDQWLEEISSSVVRELRALAGGAVDIIPLEQAVFTEDRPETPKAENVFNERPAGEYWLNFILGVITQRNARGVADNSLPPAYWAMVSLGDGDMDGVYLGAESFEHPDLHAAIRSSIYRLSGRGLPWLIEEYERTHFNALRGPRFWVNLLEPKYVSPEPGEREVRVSVPTRDCRERFGRGTNLWVKRETERGKTEIKKYWKHVDPWDGFWKAKTTEGGGIDFEFKLVKGLEPGFQEVEVYLIGRGQKKVSQALSIPVKGLRLEVRPDRAVIAPGEETRVRVRLLKVDPEGRREPIPGRKVEIKVEGLVDGKITPEGEVSTDEKGEGVLTCRAGSADVRVRILARYEPEGYKESVHGAGAVDVKMGDLFVEITGRVHYVGENEANHTQANTEFRYTGTMKQTRRTRHEERYEADRMEVSWAHMVRIVDKKPQPGCEALLVEVTSTGSQQVPLTKNKVFIIFGADKRHPERKREKSDRLVLDFRPGETVGKVKLRNPLSQCATFTERFEGLLIAHVTHSEEISSPQAAEISGSRSWGIGSFPFPFLHQDLLFGSNADSFFPPGSDFHLKWVIKRLGSGG